MNRDLQYCTNLECPIKDNCIRNISNYKKEELDNFLWLFTESPGAYREVSGNTVWVCDKQLKIKL